MTNARDGDEQTLGEFFEQYARASRSPDPTPLAAMYADTFIVGGPQGSQAFANDARFLEWLRQVHAFNQTHGMQALEVGLVDAGTLSPAHLLATVTWVARFATTGDRRIEFKIHYLLETHGGSWKILSYISEADQEEAMKELGLL